MYLSILDNNFLDHNSRWAEFKIFHRNYCFSFIIPPNYNFIFGCFEKHSNTFKKRKYIKKILKSLAKSLIEIQHIISLETLYSKLYIVITKQMLNQI